MRVRSFAGMDASPSMVRSPGMARNRPRTLHNCHSRPASLTLRRLHRDRDLAIQVWRCHLPLPCPEGKLSARVPSPELLWSGLRSIASGPDVGKRLPADRGAEPSRIPEVGGLRSQPERIDCPSVECARMRWSVPESGTGLNRRHQDFQIHPSESPKPRKC